MTKIISECDEHLSDLIVQRLNLKSHQYYLARPKMEQAIPEPIGYSAVAAVMSSDRDLSIYRRFGGLNARNLLYLQSELMELETRLHELDISANDMQKGIATWSIPRSWRSLEREGGEHLQIVLRIRELLEKYSMCSSHIIRYS
jgi:hypothetical protein